MSSVVFIGPSLTLDEARAKLRDARFLPPAARGDLYRAARDLEPSAILLIDGVFHHTAAVWHREILWALSRGIAVFGAASMGALRAVELDSFGMIGVGKIYEAFRSGSLAPFEAPFDDDAEVAVVHAPAELGSRPLTIALVDLRCIFAEAVREDVIAPAACTELIARCAAIFYADRSAARVRAAIAACDLSAAQRRVLSVRIADPARSCKRADALAALQTLARAQPAHPRAPSFTMQPALVWEQFRRTADADLHGDPEEGDVLDELRLVPRAWRAWREAAAAQANAADRRALDIQLLTLLRARGAFAELSVRAAHKRKLLGAARGPAIFSAARATRLLAWFSRRLDGEGWAQPGTAALIAEAGCRDESHLLELIDRELRFVALDSEVAQ